MDVEVVIDGTNGSHSPTKYDGDDTISTISDAQPKNCANNDSLEDASNVNEIRPQKKAKILMVEECDITKTDDGNLSNHILFFFKFCIIVIQEFLTVIYNWINNENRYDTYGE